VDQSPIAPNLLSVEEYTMPKAWYVIWFVKNKTGPVKAAKLRDSIKDHI
jgi:hypothetical protein